MASSDSEATYFDATLVNSRELIGKIFSYLGYKDLISASKVCKSWGHVARHSAKKRIPRYFVVHTNYLLNSELKVITTLPLQLESLENKLSSLKTQNPEKYYCLGFVAGSWLQNKHLVTKYSENGATLYQIIRSVITKNSEMILMEANGIVGTNELPVKPVQNLPKSKDEVMETDLVQMHSDSINPVQNLPIKEDEEMEHIAQMCSDLDNLVQNLPLTNDEEMDETDLVQVDEPEKESERDMKEFSTSANKAGYTVEVEHSSPLIYLPSSNYPPEWFDSFTLLLIPKQFGVKIKIFEIHEKLFLEVHRSNSLPEEKNFNSHPVTQEEFNSLTNLTTNDQLKSLLLFPCNSDPLWRSVLMAAIKRENSELALGGGMVNFMQRDNLLFESTYGVAISGRNVQAASIVIPLTLSNADDLREMLRLLKSRNLPEENSFAFMFSNCARGCSWYKRREMDRFEYFVGIESYIFRRLFPKTPLFGFFGDGEIGNDFYSPEHVNTFSITEPKLTKFLHQFAAVFILISIT